MNRLSQQRSCIRLVPFALAAFLALLPACSTENMVRVQSVETPAADILHPTRAIYRAEEATTAEVFLTDLRAGELEAGGDLSKVSGRIVQIRMFIHPLAGSTPIAQTACSVALRHIVLENGAIGVYSGGGFLLPSTGPEGKTFAGRIRAATLRLSAKTPGFADPLGPARLDATINAVRDDGAVRELDARVTELLLRVPPIPEEKPPAAPDDKSGTVSPDQN